MASKTEDQVEDFVAATLESIDEQISKIDSSKVVQAAEKLLAKKNTLMSARRALLGGNAMTSGSSGTRIHQQDVVGFMKSSDNELGIKGFAPGDLADALHTTEAVIRGHLNRGRNERFLKKNDLWYLRDPEKGIDTVADIEE
jgi:hypothetical protein